MLLIAGLTGGMACGKTFVANAFRDLGCYIVEADVLGHEVIQPEGAAYDHVMATFGTVDRARLASIVFNDSAALALLNSIVHPAVRERSAALFGEIRKRDPGALVIYVAAILIETGGYRQFDKLIVVTCTHDQQIERAMERRNAKLSDVLARLGRQMPVEKKKEFADYLIDASQSKEETLRQTKMVYDDLRRLAS